MKILFLADLHDFNINNLNKIKDLEYDVCITLGDINKQILNTICNLVNTDIYGILGNHDTINLFDCTRIKDLAFKNININGINFAGIDGGVRYKRGMYVMYTQEELIDKCYNLNKCDILISHETGFNYIATDLVHEGFKAIDNFISENKPKYNIFGHYHKRMVFDKYDTKCICIYQCAILDTDTDNITYIF